MLLPPRPPSWPFSSRTWRTRARGWLYKVFRASHPPIGERVDFINEYWRGELGRYADRIRP